MKELSDVGFDLGGPMVRDRLWGWGSYGRTEEHAVHAERRPRFARTREHCVQDHGPAQRARAAGVPLLPRQQEQDRPRRQPAAGTGDDLGSERPDPALQGAGQYRRGQQRLSHGRFGYVGNGFRLMPQGGLQASAFRDAGRVRHGSFYLLRDRSSRLQRTGGRQLGPRTARDHLRRQLAEHRDDERLEYPGSGVDSLHATDFATTGSIQAWFGVRSSHRARR